MVSLFGVSKVFIVNISNFVEVRRQFLRKIVDCFGCPCLQGLSEGIICEELPPLGSTTGEQEDCVGCLQNCVFSATRLS